MRLVGDNIAVKMDAVEDTTSGGLVSATAEKPRTGEVVVVGPGDYYSGQLQPMTVKVGDRVLLSSYGGEELNIKGAKIRVTTESDVVAILEEGDEA